LSRLIVEHANDVITFSYCSLDFCFDDKSVFIFVFVLMTGRFVLMTGLFVLMPGQYFDGRLSFHDNDALFLPSHPNVNILMLSSFSNFNKHLQNLLQLTPIILLSASLKVS
jgi:hypothetical protein